MQDKVTSRVNARRRGEFGRRELLRSLAVLTGGYAAANLLLESSGFAATQGSQREAQSAGVDADVIRYPSPSGNYEIEGYLAKPKTTGSHLAVIVIHDNRGLNEHVRDVTRRFATEGFVALAPDLLSSAGGTASLKTPQAATQAIGRLPIYGTIDDLKATFEYLEKDPGVDGQKIATVGFGWGGWRSFALAAEVPNLYKAVVFYGGTPDDGLDEIKAPVLAHYAERDGAVTGQVVWTRTQMKKSGGQYQYFVYPDTDHAFFNDTTGNQFNPAAAKLAWVRTVAFLRNQPLPNSVTLGKGDILTPTGQGEISVPLD